MPSSSCTNQRQIYILTDGCGFLLEEWINARIKIKESSENEKYSILKGMEGAARDQNVF